LNLIKKTLAGDRIKLFQVACFLRAYRTLVRDRIKEKFIISLLFFAEI
jgi:hypothetical protein